MCKIFFSFSSVVDLNLKYFYDKSRLFLTLSFTDFSNQYFKQLISLQYLHITIIIIQSKDQIGIDLNHFSSVLLIARSHFTDIVNTGLKHFTKMV
jgi:hypothetical protein